MADEPSKDRITFKCNKCGYPVSIDKANPPNDDDILSCFGPGCGHKFGTYAEVKEGMLALAKAELNKMLEDTLRDIPGITITKA
jgi:hypothetical protein